MQGMHFFCVCFVNVMSCQAHRFKLTAYALLACFKMKCTDKNNQIKSTTLSLSVCLLISEPLQPLPRSTSLLSKPSPTGGASFVWRDTFLLRDSGLGLLPLGGGGGGRFFLGAVFGCVLWGGGGGGGGFGGLRGL